MQEHTPQLIYAVSVRATLDSLDFEESLSAINALFSILTDPSYDDVRKFRADHSLYPSGTVEFLNEEWYIAYRVADNGDVQISIMRRVSDLLPRLLAYWNGILSYADRCQMIVQRLERLAVLLDGEAVNLVFLLGAHAVNGAEVNSVPE